jgi:hypothetical protein
VPQPTTLLRAPNNTKPLPKKFHNNNNNINNNNNNKYYVDETAGTEAEIKHDDGQITHRQTYTLTIVRI